MIKLKSLLNEVEQKWRWTYAEAKPIADKVGGKIVGSVKTKGFSDNDLDIKVDKITPEIQAMVIGMGYKDIGSQLVSPAEIRKSRKFGRDDRYWLRSHTFVDFSVGKFIQLWAIEHDTDFVKL